MAGIAAGVRAFAQPPGGLLKPGIFDPLPLAFNDGKYVGQDNLPGEIIEGAVGLLSCFNLFSWMHGYDFGMRDACLKEAERTAFQGLPAYGLGGYGEASAADVFEAGISCSYGNEADPPSADCACRLAAAALGGSYRPAKVRADDRTCSNIEIMVRRTVGFFSGDGTLRRIGFDFGSGYGERIDSGYGWFLNDTGIWDMTASRDPLPSDRTLQLLVRYVLCRDSGDPVLEKVENIGLVNPRLGCAYLTNVSKIPQEAIQAAEDIIGKR
ncbi:MAG: hypothetical protein ACOX8X_02110 [Methanomethylophilus sp.]|jgi:hypothetical protein